MEYKLVLEEHMFVLCAETKHCQVACGFDSDSCTYKTTEPNALKHWLCVPITYLNSQWSILLHPAQGFCNSVKVWKLYANSECSATVKFSKNLFFCDTLSASFGFKHFQQSQRITSSSHFCCCCNYLHCTRRKVQKLYANAECDVIVTQAKSELLCYTCATLSQSTRQSPEQLLI